MTRDDVWKALVEAIREELDDPNVAVEPAMTAADIPGWDSLAHVRIVMNVEDRTDGVIAMKATYRAATVGELAEMVFRSAGKAAPT